MYILEDKMRISDILIIIWVIIVMALDKFVQSYYEIVILIITGIFLYGIHRANMKESLKHIGVKENKKEMQK